MNEGNYLLRGARNTLLDMLLEPIGATYPLFDLPVKPDVDVVYYDNPAEVRVSYVQPDVSYQVYEALDKPLKGQHSDRGTDIVLKTDTLKEQVHAFKIKATKILYPEPEADGKLPPAKIPLSNSLFKVANVRVGINAGLVVVPEKSDINYGDKITLTIKNAQKGAYYSIIYYDNGINNQEIEQLMDVNAGPVAEKVAEVRDQDSKIITPAHTRISETLLGDDADLQVKTLYGLREDIQLRIAVIDKNTDLAGMLKAVTTINVAPNLKLASTWVSGTPAIEYNKSGAADYGSMVSIRLIDAQLSTQYRIRLDEIDADATNPAIHDFLCDWMTGIKGVMDIPMSAGVSEDMIVRVIARKTADNLQGELESQVFIAVYPDRGKKITVAANPDPGINGKIVKVYAPQRGIIYQLHNIKTDELLAPPVFYNRNYGIGKTRIGQDFMATKYQEGDAMGTDWMVKSLFAVDAMEDKDNIELPTGAITEDTKFEVLATKSTTGFAAVIKMITAKS
ncbi:hypothetical protein [Pedobacter psychroterrae]|uniref:Uncharacterized protein n=1 Tax=Pedobacter psychroterrae TaxID=2530453 RepID=A0A4R0NP64_9SPHI|nr:hypothetical protein [Pedobacter psychroterrae]TCD01778.1 hypothetical protein EZ437_13765 [Pedobacter psychroterrae]